MGMSVIKFAVPEMLHNLHPGQNKYFGSHVFWHLQIPAERQVPAHQFSETLPMEIAYEQAVPGLWRNGHRPGLCLCPDRVSEGSVLLFCRVEYCPQGKGRRLCDDPLI